MTGHLLGAAGAVEAIATVLALHDRKAPPTINLDDLDDDVSLDVVRGEPRDLPDGELLALNNSFGFGGHNVAVAFRTVRTPVTARTRPASQAGKVRSSRQGRRPAQPADAARRCSSTRARSS